MSGKNNFEINWGDRDVEKYFSQGQEMSPMVWMFRSGVSEPQRVKFSDQSAHKASLLGLKRNANMIKTFKGA